ncbi:MAG: sulfite exporter TauE/SafE family protein [Firmicutes bacterium]|nr:sulfite exporter TauE/SafE family protein [Bacillota bacterium]
MEHWGLLTPEQFVIALLIVLFAFTVRGSLGFGSGLISVSLLIWFVPVTAAVPLVYLIDTVGSLLLGAYDFRHISWQEMPALWPATVGGLVLGGIVLATLSPQHLMAILGSFVLAYVVYAVAMQPSRLPLISRWWGAPLGFLGGFMGSLYGGGGPAIVAYLQMRHLNPRSFRASFQFIAMTDSLTRGILYWMLGFLTLPVFLTAVVLWPAVVLGLWIGHRIHVALNPRQFQYAVLFMLAVVGLKLVIL